MLFYLLTLMKYEQGINLGRLNIHSPHRDLSRNPNFQPSSWKCLLQLKRPMPRFPSECLSIQLLLGHSYRVPSNLRWPLYTQATPKQFGQLATLTTTHSNAILARTQAYLFQITLSSVIPHKYYPL